MASKSIQRSIVIGVMQRNFPLNPITRNSLNHLPVRTIVIDSSPSQVVMPSSSISVIHRPDEEGFFPISLLRDLFEEFLKSKASRLLLLEGDMVPDGSTIQRAAVALDNTKIFYSESDPQSANAYIRREGLAGVILRSEADRIWRWMSSQEPARLRAYEGYCDTFLWYAVKSETSGYSTSTSGPDWIPVTHLTHGDETRVTKRQRLDMKLYRRRMADVIMLAMECNEFDVEAQP